jgi:hypothetical protein
MTFDMDKLRDSINEAFKGLKDMDINEKISAISEYRYVQQILNDLQDDPVELALRFIGEICREKEAHLRTMQTVNEVAAALCKVNLVGRDGQFGDATKQAFETIKAFIDQHGPKIDRPQPGDGG